MAKQGFKAAPQMNIQLALSCLLVPQLAFAQGTLTVSQAAWDGLAAEERSTIQSTYAVDLRPNGSFGLVLDNQGINESTPGTSGGAALGSALAQSTYIDRAFRGNGSYSATGQLAVGILGAVLGSAADRPAVQQFHFRYALKMPTGEIQSFDSVQRDAFRHPAGMCLGIPELQPVSQAVCIDTTEDLRRKLLTAAKREPQIPVEREMASGSAEGVATPETDSRGCKVGTVPPFFTAAHKCLAIGGKLL